LIIRQKVQRRHSLELKTQENEGVSDKFKRASSPPLKSSQAVNVVSPDTDEKEND